MKRFVLAIITVVFLVLVLMWWLWSISGNDNYVRPVTEQIDIATTTVRVPIFIYHSVRPDFPAETNLEKQFSITPELFEEQLKYLSQHGYQVITLDRLADIVAGATTSPSAKLVVLTFDDGWKNQYLYAFPLLKKYHMIGTFFIYTNPIGKEPNFLTWPQIKEMAEAGMVIGDHSLTHPYLNKLTPEQLRHEVLGAKKILEEQLGQSVTDFASPFGYTDEHLVALIKEAGFKTGRTTYRGATHSTADLFKLTGFLVHRQMLDFTWALQFSK